MRRTVLAVAAMALVVLSGHASSQQAAKPQLFEVKLGPEIKTPLSGRLIIEAMRILPLPGNPPLPPGSPEGADTMPDPNALNSAGVPHGFSNAMVTARLLPERGGFYSAAFEIDQLASGKSVMMNADQISWPKPFSQLPPGDYVIGLHLDVDHNFNVDAFAGGDYNSTPVRVTLPGSTPPRLEIMRGPMRDGASTMRLSSQQAEWRTHVRRAEVDSKLLSAFHGKPVRLRAQVVLPPGYETGNKAYPVVYNFQYHAPIGLGTPQGLTPEFIYKSMVDGYAPPMLHVLPDQSAEYGTHMWANSANNGPWSSALVEELIPHVEKEFRVDARPQARFLYGDQGGSWPALWQQVAHPKVFGGVWVNQPEMVGFSDFMRTDITAKAANVFHAADGSPKMMIRNASPESWSPGDIALPERPAAGGPMMATQSFEHLERVRGDTGGRIHSREAIFSPRGSDGAPKPLFSRSTGDVDPAVADFWRRNYDMTYLIAANWPTLKADLDRKIHVVGVTIDRFYNFDATRRLEGVLNGLGAKAEFTFFDSHMIDRDVLTPAMMAMEKIAHPTSAFAPKPGVTQRPRINILPPAAPILPSQWP